MSNDQTASGDVPTRPESVAPYSLSALATWLQLSAPADDVPVSGVSLGSHSVQPGDLYAALPGAKTHGARYAAEAAAAGAVAILTDPEGAYIVSEAGVTIPVVVVLSPRRVMGAVAAKLYGEPASALTLIGVTGTQGKTTTTQLVNAGLAAAGLKTAVIGTMGTWIDGRPVKSQLTTPEAPDLHALFAVMRERGVDVCAMEVSSHAIVQGRVDGVVFDLAVFTNLGRDHLDFHPTIEDYFAAKAELFTPVRARRALVNLDDPYGRRLLGEAQIPTHTFSISDDAAEWFADQLAFAGTRSTFSVRSPDGSRIDSAAGLVGVFNVANSLCAIAAIGECGYDIQAAARGIAETRAVAGRMEQIDGGQAFNVIVDYAHKPDAVTAVLESLRPITAGELVVVIGAGGDRDQGKRPIMGRIAARLADVLVVTDDNPRSEDPAAVRSEVIAGARSVPPEQAARIVELGDRAAAIELVLSQARPGDTILVAGKGHETGQEIAGVVHPFDDREVCRTVLKSLVGKENPS